ncbi:hypothetical protein A0J61_08106 [Choanephora cucurbitarum]|uniref:GATA-type domain-containing protein n=1 Tax=Choanephora cucurbitarum TaxID=101091 RepID=A0A1C7N450_9FUNG|nr:hypothetical protein A0J61_08106 [Choanephora cucurbitarum]
MNVSALNTPFSPPYDYQHTHHRHAELSNENYHQRLFFDRQPSPEDIVHHNSSNDKGEPIVSAFRRVSPVHTMPSPPELLLDTSEDEDESVSSLVSTSSFRKRKSVPHKSPSHSMVDKSVVFQLNENHTPQVLYRGGGILWSLRQRVSMARHHRKTLSKNRLSAPRPERRVRPMQIEIPRHHWSRDNTIYDDLVSPIHHDWQPKPTSTPPSEDRSIPAEQPPIISSWQEDDESIKSSHRKKPTARRKNSQNQTSSGRPSRVKGPCQACHETSDGCMRKAFNWPFPTSTIFNDKGKPFVYLCNKCGLRYNKSGGCVCRHCRWVLCKEEKRKAMHLIDQMRQSRPDGQVDPEEDIDLFFCTPKYWNCGRPWKVGWILNSQHDAEDEEMMMGHSPSLSEATL